MRRKCEMLDYIIGEPGKLTGLNKEELILGIKTYVLNIDLMCQKLVQSLDVQSADRIRKARHYYKVFQDNLAIRDSVVSFLNRSYDIMNDIKDTNIYKEKSRSLWGIHIPKLAYDASFDSYFIMHFDYVDLRSQIEDIQTYIIDFKNEVEVAKYKESITDVLKWIGIEDSTNIQKDALNNLGEYGVLELGTSFTHDIIKYYIKSIASKILLP